MTDTLVTLHPWTGYVVFLVAIVVASLGFKRAKDGREFEAAPFSLAMVLLDLQVTLGIVIYVLLEAWDRGAMIAYVHPALALLALAWGHMTLGRARREQMAADAYRKAARGLVVAVVLIAASIGVASAA